MNIQSVLVGIVQTILNQIFSYFNLPICIIALNCSFFKVYFDSLRNICNDCGCFCFICSPITKPRTEEWRLHSEFFVEFACPFFRFLYYFRGKLINTFCEELFEERQYHPCQSHSRSGYRRGRGSYSPHVALTDCCIFVTFSPSGLNSDTEYGKLSSVKAFCVLLLEG